MFDFKNKIAVVTGGAQGIGKCICEEFERAGAKVCTIDLQENDYFTGDLADKKTLEAFAEKVISDYGHVDFLINNALPKTCGITEGSYVTSYTDFSGSIDLCCWSTYASLTV